MPTGVMSFTARSFKTSADSSGNPFIVMKGACSDPAVLFARIIIGVSAGGVSCVPTDPTDDLLSFCISQTDFNHLLACLKKVPAVISISYDILIDGISVTGISCVSLLTGLSLLEELAGQKAAPKPYE